MAAKKPTAKKAAAKRVSAAKKTSRGASAERVSPGKTTARRYTAEDTLRLFISTYSKF